MKCTRSRGLGSTPRIAAVLVAQVAFIAAGVFLGGSDASSPGGQPVASPAEVRLQAMVDAGTCWGNDGVAHGYPSRVWVRTASGYELRGQAKVDAILKSGNYKKAVRFCE